MHDGRSRKAGTEPMSSRHDAKTGRSARGSRGVCDGQLWHLVFKGPRRFKFRCQKKSIAFECCVPQTSAYLLVRVQKVT